MENERRYRRRNSDVKEENMESSEQEPRTVRHEYGSSSAGDSIGQARRVIDELEARINDARRVPMSKTLSIIDTGELIDLIGQLRIVLPHTVVQAQAILDERKKILGEAKEEAKASTGKADAYYTEKVENAKRFEQDVKMEADAYDKQIRQKAPGGFKRNYCGREHPGRTDRFQRPAAGAEAGGGQRNHPPRPGLRR